MIDGVAKIDIPPEILITNVNDHIMGIVYRTYPYFIQNLHSNNYLKIRAIPASTLKIVDQINDHILNLMPCSPMKLYNLPYYIYIYMYYLIFTN